ncbi:cyclosporin 16, putative [Leishmania panamensis]|uniref:Cyclosporin 16, putative n=1 Tax=Leishmania panamensis TaxID=5679 RepID=A0A088RPW0_LEIPA|nr:cyclosporin 16, putative [Leishmania panamensis]AIN97269.1 cyclosporin 16, putative [Leishmania panamensis]
MHISLQDAHDVFSAETPASAHTTSLVTAQAIHDVCVHLDSLGALIATIDAAGVVRVWRKLPRGLLFITELNKVFPPACSVGATAGHERRTCHYWAHAYTALQVLVFVCVEEEAEFDLDASAAVAQTPLRTVRVHMRQVNSVTLTVEERDSFIFQVPVQRVVSAAVSAGGTALHRNDGVQRRAHDSRGAQDGACWTPRTSLAYTRRPAFLTHQYAPHIAFFVTLPPSSATPGARSGGSGVVMCPCFTSAMSTGGRSNHTAGTVRSYAPTRLSVANAIVACAQQELGLERTGTSACVLIDSGGVVDYCIIEAATAPNTLSSTASGGLTLSVMAGLAVVPPTSREARVWRQWIRFDRRQRTGFFSLVQDAQQALKVCKVDERQATADKITGAIAAADVQVLPATVQLTSDGRHVLMWSFRLLRVAATPAAVVSSQPASRIPSTERRYNMTVESCLHLLDFTTGMCIGRHTEPVGVFTTSEDLAFGATEWADYVQLRSRALALHLHTEPSATAKNQFYVMVPELPVEQLLGVRAVSHEAAEVATTEVAGRMVHVYEVTLEAAVSSPSAAQSSATVRRLSHAPGEWEAIVRRGAEHPLHGSHHNPTDVGKDSCWSGLVTSQTAWNVLHLLSPNEYGLTVKEGSHTRDEACSRAKATARAHSGLSICRAPLVLLRRAVTTSQDLKNLIAASPIGAALGADARKGLFVAPRAPDTTGGAAPGEVLLLASSVDMSSAALLVYSRERPWGSAAVGRILSEAAPLQTEEQLSEEGERLQEQRRHETWAHALRELHRGRDDVCGTLLLAAVAPQAFSTAAAPEAAGEATATSPSIIADVAGSSTNNGEAQQEKTTEAAAITSARIATTRRATPVTDEEAAVRKLLKDLIPPLSTFSPPVALVHVRGYGSIRVHLLPSIAPLATDNFVRLARRHYYDRLTFHRVIPAAIVQGGCPRGDGTGGESAFADGALFSDEGLALFPFFSHTANPLCCWLCMANAGPHTNGSQFFFTVPGGEAMPWLNGHHTVFGYAIEGLDVVRAISVAARDKEDKPLSPIMMERVDVLST